MALATYGAGPAQAAGQYAAERWDASLQPIGEASAITVVLGVSAGWLLIAAFALSLTRAARRGDRPADRYARERSLPPPPHDPAREVNPGQTRIAFPDDS